MKQLVKKAFKDTLPVLTGYLVLGFGFGIIMISSGYGVFLTFIMSLLIYAGSMQYAAVGLLTGGASFLTTAMTTLMVNLRHIFYGISMLDRYKWAGKRKPYLIFSLTDETYSLVCGDLGVHYDQKIDYCFLVSLFDHVYWVTGSVLGAAVGSILPFNMIGVDFALTAMFITIFIEQWLTSKRHTPAVIGLVASFVCLLIFGKDEFLIPSMIVITLLLCVDITSIPRKGHKHP